MIIIRYKNGLYDRMCFLTSAPVLDHDNNAYLNGLHFSWNLNEPNEAISIVSAEIKLSIA